MARILVTGGAGFIGGNFIRHVLAGGDHVVANVDCLTYAADPGSLVDLPAGRHELSEIDICDRARVDAVFERFRPDAVVHFAAESHVDRSIEDPTAFVRTNVLGTQVMLDAALAWHARAGDGFRFLHVSTDEVYGSLGPDDAAFSETTPYAPNSPYAASKAAADHLARAWYRTYDLPVVVTNCSNNYGPRQFPEKLIPLMLINALEREPLPVYGDGQQRRDWLFVEDHCAALMRVLEAGRPGQVYNIGGGAEKTNLEVVETLCDLLDARLDGPSRRDLIEFVTDRPGHDRRYAIDSTRIWEELGWRPAVNFADGLARTVDWYLANRDWWQRIRDGRYRSERLGLSRSG